MMFFAVCYMLKTCLYQFNTTFLDSCIIELAACEWLLFSSVCLCCITLLLSYVLVLSMSNDASTTHLCKSQ